jgi:DNA polymerase-3 subunit delta'
MSDLPESDRIEGVPHPRATARLFGHDAAQTAVLDAFSSGRQHHAWMLQGPRGIGKATFAYHLARFLIATSPAGPADIFGDNPAPSTLHIDPEHPVARRVAVGSESGLFVLRRAVDEKDRSKLKTVITVDEARKLKEFLTMSAPDGTPRVVIIDAADEMNVQTANAILKLLEEPPANTTLLLICHQPSRLLPTIRSRCRTLSFGRLSADHMTQALTQADVPLPTNMDYLNELAVGSVGEALRLLNLGGLDTYARLVELLQNAPGLDRAKLGKLGDGMVGRAKAPHFDLFLNQIDTLLSRIARTGIAEAPSLEAAHNEGALLQRLCPNQAASKAWAALHQDIGARLRHGKAVNLDPAVLVIDTGLKIDQEAAKWATKR